jgi:hypothetical protein
VSRLDPHEREALQTMIAGVVHMHDSKRWQQSANVPVAAREPARVKAAFQGDDAVSAAGASALQPHIESRILLLREQRVMLDADLATLYRVETKIWCRQ